MSLQDTTERIESMVRAVEADPEHIGVLSTGEKIAVALVLDRVDLFPRGNYTILEAVDRLGPDWLRAAIAAQKARS